MTQRKFIIFDLDGTLLDTTKGVLTSIDYVIKQMNLAELDEKQKASFIGPPIQNSFQETYKLDDVNTKKCADLFRDVYKNTNLFLATLYPSVLNVLKELKDRGYKIGIATYKRFDYTLQLVDYFGITEYCDVIHGSDFEGKLQKKDIIKLCLDDMKVDDYTKAVMVGDTIHDAKGASEIGIPFIAVTYGFGFRNTQECGEYNISAFINNFEELLDVLN